MWRVGSRTGDTRPANDRRSARSSSATSGSWPGSRTWKGSATWSTSPRPIPRVMALGMDGKWARAEEPLHWLVDSPDPVHSGDPATREARSAEDAQDAHQGGGPGPAVRRGDGPGHRTSRSAWSPRPTGARAWPSGTRRRRGRGARACTARCSARSSSPGARSRGCSGIRARATRSGAPPRRTRRSSPTSSRPSAPTSTSPSCRSTSSRSAGSSRRATPRAGTPCRRPSG